MPDIVDAVAQAICNATGHDHWPPPSERGCNHYRRQAQAAIDALGLDMQWGWQLGDFTPSAYDSEQETRERVAELNAMFTFDPKSKRHSSQIRRIVHRLVSPWNREEVAADA